MGFGIEVFVEYFFREAEFRVKRLAASRWPVVDAIVIESKVRDSVMGCRVIVIRYRYRNSDERFEGTHKEPFFFDNYAAAYLNRFPGGSAFPVRVNPKDHSKSIQAEIPTFQKEQG